MQGINGLYDDEQSERKEAFVRLEQLRKKGTVTDDAAELALYREEKFSFVQGRKIWWIRF